jgi:hypothetical protein
VKTIFASTALAEEAIAQGSENVEPPLNMLTTTPYNMIRMVVRLTPVVQGKQSVEDILRWKDPRKTGVILLLYVVVCK